MAVPDKGNIPGCLGNKVNTPKKYAKWSPSHVDFLSLIVTLQQSLAANAGTLYQNTKF